MHTQVELTHADHAVLMRLARRAYTDKSFRVCRAMQEHDARDAFFARKLQCCPRIVTYVMAITNCSGC